MRGVAGCGVAKIFSWQTFVVTIAGIVWKQSV